MLALFGVPHLDRILDGYQQRRPLAAGWQARIPLHQAWPLLVHAALFGGGYGTSAVAALRRARG
jgi:fructosamine-3-kinase